MNAGHGLEELTTGIGLQAPCCAEDTDREPKPVVDVQPMKLASPVGLLT